MLGQSTLALAFILAQPAEVTTADSTSTGYFPANLFLVRATMVSLKKAKPPNELGSFAITRVYAGGVSIKGKTFECSTSYHYMGSSTVGDGNYRHVHILEKDTEGLWWLYLDGKEKKLRPELRGDVVDAYWIRSFPITTGKFGTVGLGIGRDPKEQWKQGLAWAEAVETVYKAKSDEERAVILRRLAATERSPVAAWAINLLGKVNPKGTTEFLKTLAANEKLSGEAHVVLDKTLYRLDYPRWRSKDHWERLLPRWIGSPDLSYYKDGMHRLSEGFANHQIDFAFYTKMLDSVLAKADRLKDGQEEALGRELSYPPFQEAERPRGFDWLAGYVRHGKTAFVRAHAAAGFRYCAPLSATQLKVIRALREESTEPQVQQALDTVLKTR